MSPANPSTRPAPVKKGGLTDRWLAKYPNLWGDLSANSGNNALARDKEFARAFLARHQNKLLFGSDCSCRDGHGAGSGALLPHPEEQVRRPGNAGAIEGTDHT